MQHSALVLLATAATAVSAVVLGEPQTPVLGKTTVAGCFYSLGELKLVSNEDLNSGGLCSAACRKTNNTVAATSL